MVHASLIGPVRWAFPARILPAANDSGAAPRRRVFPMLEAATRLRSRVRRHCLGRPPQPSKGARQAPCRAGRARLRRTARSTRPPTADRPRSRPIPRRTRTAPAPPRRGPRTPSDRRTHRTCAPARSGRRTCGWSPGWLRCSSAASAATPQNSTTRAVSPSRSGHAATTAPATTTSQIHSDNSMLLRAPRALRDAREQQRARRGDEVQHDHQDDHLGHTEAEADLRERSREHVHRVEAVHVEEQRDQEAQQQHPVLGDAPQALPHAGLLARRLASGARPVAQQQQSRQREHEEPRRDDQRQVLRADPWHTSTTTRHSNPPA